MSQAIVNAIYKLMQTGMPLTGSSVDPRGLAANKPAADSVDPGVTYWSVDTDPHGDAIEVSNGTTWTVI